MILVFSLGLVLLFFNLVFSKYFVAPNRYSVCLGLLKSMFGVGVSVFQYFFLSLFIALLVMNFCGNIPGFNSSSIYYFFTASFSVTIWVSLMVVVYSTQLKSFMAHMLPYGAPTGLFLFLPLIEVFSQIIRPFTLMVRLSTNLSSGHIMLYMFSFFSLSSFIMTGLISVLLLALFILELMISILQAYIFSSLALLYVSETL